MIKHERIVSLQWALHRSMYAQANKNVPNASTEPRRIGSSLSAVNKMVARGEEMRVLLPTVIGVDPLSARLDWEQAVKNYWHSFSVDIPMGGRDLDISWTIDVNDPAKADAIKSLGLKNLTDKSLEAYLFGETNGVPNVQEEYLFRYATPSNLEDYLLWRWCLIYRRVLNPDADPSILDKNPDIDFYLYDNAKAKKIAKSSLDLQRKALAKWAEVTANSELKEQVAFIFGDNPFDFSKDKEDRDFELDSKLKIYADTQPQKFLDVVSDKNLKTKATIEQYIALGILKRLASTSIVVDGTDPSLILGNNINEVLQYFLNPVNSGVVAEYSALYKAQLAKLEENSK